MTDSFMHNHQSALDSQREEAAINWRFPEPDNDDIYERLYEEEVQESLDRLEKLGFKDIKESDLDTESIEEAVRKKFEELPEPGDYDD
ncbi:MAG: hypothetical protein MK084_07400 [Prochlorococcus sp. ALOHA_A2.0_50]|nr:hypothetical protein [Prochlorococcus sp. ALOHA_A2.0_50]